MTWYWKVQFWTKTNAGGWYFSGQTPYFRGDVQKAQSEHLIAYEDSGNDATTLLWWSRDGWVKFEQLP